MNSRFIVLCLILSTLLYPSCDPIEIDGPNPPDESQADLIGTWIAAGEDIAQNYWNEIDSISLNFTSNNQYEWQQVNNDGSTILYNGTYAIDSGDLQIFPIVIAQLAPETATYNGIYEINESVNPLELSIEMVQTVPDIGQEAPSYTEGFGSSSLGVDNIHRFIFLP